MRYYSHHIGDFDRATRHLTRIERSVYRDLIEMYYDTQAQIPLDLQAVCRKIIARTNEEATAVEQVLNEFFTETPTGWYHDRCEAEIEAFLESSSQKSAAGRASAAKKAAKRQQAINGKSTTVEQALNGCATDCQRDVNGTQTNQEPRTKNRTTPDGVEAPKRPTRKCPESFLVTDDLKTWAAENFPGVDLMQQTGAFRDHTFKTAISDWAGAWRNWVRRSSEYSGPGRSAGHQRPPTSAQMAMAQACPTLVAPHLQQFVRPQNPTCTEAIDADTRRLD